MSPCHVGNRTTFSGYVLCQRTHEPLRTTRNYMSATSILRKLIKSNREILNEYRDILDR